MPKASIYFNKVLFKKQMEPIIGKTNNNEFFTTESRNITLQNSYAEYCFPFSIEKVYQLSSYLNNCFHFQ